MATRAELYVGKIVAEAAYIEIAFAGGDRAAVAPEINGIKVIIMLYETVAHFCLKEIIVKPVDVEDSSMSAGTVDRHVRTEFADDCGDDLACIV